MMRIAASAFMLLTALTVSAIAKDPDQGAWMIRMLACEGPDAKMEVYVPQSIVFGKAPIAQALARPVIGYSANLVENDALPT
jgi:hypothetical protein